MGRLAWYQIFCLQLLLLHCESCAKLCSHDQSSALLQFKQLFSLEYHSSSHCNEKFPFYPKMKFWVEDKDCCSWDGVTCDKVTGHVIHLDLSCSWLHGTIPSNNTLFSLPHIQILNLAFNDFNFSEIPSNINRFRNLTILNLSNSNFSGQIPYEISHLSKLVSLDLSNNHVSLETPVLNGLVQNLGKLEGLILDFVDMSTILLQTGSLMNVSSSLTYLSLNHCGLQGRIPDNIFRLPNLQLLSLWDNLELTGVFPNVNWSSPLRYLYISDMSSSGDLPDSFSNLKSLRQLSLHNCHFMGSIPVSVSNLTQLTVLDLSFNHFSGHIPLFLSNLDKLNHLDLSSNNFSGEIPNILVNLTQVSFLAFPANQLVGPIPSVLGKLPNLVSIYLHGNSLNGTIPPWLSTSLETINLSDNQLTGNIPEFRSDSLRRLYLRNNKLDGSIPSSFFELGNLTDLELSLNNLSGVVQLSMFAKLKNLQLLDISDNSLSLNTTTEANSSFPKLRYLCLSACNISEFPEILRAQDQLFQLDLSKNKIHGQVPSWIAEMGKATLRFLHLYQNFLTGIDHLPWKSLQVLDLRFNLLQGPLVVPPPYMRIFFMSNNNLTGEIPQAICNLRTIEILDLSHNSLNGTIPKCMGNFSSLHVMDLRKNRFLGTIPDTFARGNSFRSLNFNENSLEGPIPRSLMNCTMLEVLDLGNNKIKDIFPYWLDNLPKLQVLVLRSNNFYGAIWSSANANHSFTKLRIFDLSNNNFTSSFSARYFENMKAMMNIGEAEKDLKYLGEGYYQDSIKVTLKGLEIELEKIITIFTTIDFSNNNFSGDIPKLIGNLHALRLLNLSHNNLRGCIPSSLGNLTALESLDLSSNKLVGVIPWQLTSLNFLQVLNLSENQLMGPIPRTTHFDTFSNDSYSGNLGLCGFPLSKNCGNDKGPESAPMIFHDPQNSSSWYDWPVLLAGFGCGLGIGLFIGYIVFSTGKPQWFVRMVEKEQLQKVRLQNRRLRLRGRRNL